MKPIPFPELSGRAALAVSLLLLAMLTGVALWTRPLIPIDETRYVSVAWEMWLRGDFLVPFKNGETYSHKPPFLFWMFQAGWAVFGVNDVWPRLVSPLFSAASLGLTLLLARRLWPQQPARASSAVLVLCSLLWWIVFSTMAMFDVVLAFWVLVGMHGVLSMAQGKRRGVVLLGVAIGLGVLTKGPVILLNVLPITVLALWWQPSLRARWGRWFGGVGLAVLLGAAIALLWALPAGYSGGEAYRNAIFWGQTADRMVDSFAHRRPVWWYLPLLPIMLFPWLVWPEFWRALRRHIGEGLDAGSRFCLAWILPVLVAFSFVSGKQPHYLLPLFPAFALLLARVVTTRSQGGIALPVLLAMALGGLLVAVARDMIPGASRSLAALPALWPGIMLMLLAFAIGIAARRGSAVMSLTLLGTTTLVLFQIAARPAVEPAYNIQPIAQAIRQVQLAGHPVANLAKYHAQYQFAGRLQAPLVELRDSLQQQLTWLRSNPQGYAVLYLDELKQANTQIVRHRQAYRGGAVVLIDAPTAVSVLTAVKAP